MASQSSLSPRPRQHALPEPQTSWFAAFSSRRCSPWPSSGRATQATKPTTSARIPPRSPTLGRSCPPEPTPAVRGRPPRWERCSAARRNSVPMGGPLRDPSPQPPMLIHCSCCGPLGTCGYGPDFCGTGCLNNCNATAMCGFYSEGGTEKCGMNLCCGAAGWCGVRYP